MNPVVFLGWGNLWNHTATKGNISAPVGIRDPLEVSSWVGPQLANRFWATCRPAAQRWAGLPANTWRWPEDDPGHWQEDEIILTTWNVEIWRTRWGQVPTVSSHGFGRRNRRWVDEWITWIAWITWITWDDSGKPWEVAHRWRPTRHRKKCAGHRSSHSLKSTLEPGFSF